MSDVRIESAGRLTSIRSEYFESVDAAIPGAQEIAIVVLIELLLTKLAYLLSSPTGPLRLQSRPAVLFVLCTWLVRTTADIFDPQNSHATHVTFSQTA